MTRCLQYLIVAAALGGVAYIEVSSAAPRTNKVLIVALVSVAGIGSVLDGLARAWSEYMGPEAKQVDVEDPVKVLFLGILGETGLDLTDIGLTVFVVRRARRVFFRQLQWRIFRFRIESNPRPTHIFWTRNKGVLGRCWRERRRATLDHTVHYKTADKCQSRQEWRQLPKATREGLTWADYKQVRDFEYVEAHPIIDTHGRYHGCLVIQTAKKNKGRLGQRRVQQLTERACATLATVLAS